MAVYFIAKNPQNEKETNIINDKNQTTYSEAKTLNFDEQYRLGNITANEYIKLRFETKNQDDKQEHLTDFIEKHLDELSDDTILYIQEKLCVENIIGLQDDEPQKTSALTDIFMPSVYASAEVSNDDKINIITSPNKKFMIWYKTSGEDACSIEYAKQIANFFEETTEKYDELFNTKYTFESKIMNSTLSKKVIKLLNNLGYTEDEFKNSMQVFIRQTDEDVLASYRKIPNGLEQRLGLVAGDIVDNTVTFIMPYIIMDYNKLKDNEEEAVQVINHELFHHYQAQVLPSQNGGKKVVDEYVGESTANLASCLVSQKTTNRGFLNYWAGLAMNSPYELLSDEWIEGYGKTKIGYALFTYLYHYYSELPDGIDKIKNAMYAENFLKALTQNVALETSNNIQDNYMLGLLEQKYYNKNLVHNPEEFEEINYRKKLDCNYAIAKQTDDIDVELPPIGIQYYKIIPDKKHKLKIEFIREKENIVAIFVGEKGGEYTELGRFDSGYDLNYTFNDDGLNYDNYYFIVGNSSTTYKHRYTVRFTMDEIKEAEEESEAVKEMESLNWTEKLIHGKEVTIEDIPESGYLSFISTWNLDEDKENVYITYYYEDGKITREVFTNYFATGISDDIKQGYIDDVKNNPRMYKDNYIVRGHRLICEYTKEQIELEGETLDDLINIINKKSIMGGKEFVFDFKPEL